MSETKMIAVGQFAVLGDESGAMLVRTDGSQMQGAVDSRVAPVAAALLAESPPTKEAVDKAVTDKLAAEDIALRSDNGYPRTVNGAPVIAITDAAYNATFMTARVEDGAPTDDATSLIGDRLVELGYTPDTKVWGGEPVIALTDAENNWTFLTARALDGGPTDLAADLIGERITERGWTAALAGPRPCLGDSLTEDDAWVGGLAAATGIPTFDLGLAGQTSTEIAVRAGALPLLLTVSGSSIPASGPVEVTAKVPTTSWRTVVGVQRRIRGTLAGIEGDFILGWSTDPKYYFERLAAGAVTACPAASPFTVAPAAKTAVGFERMPVVYWSGRNNTTALADLKRDDAAMMNRFPNRKTAILSCTTLTTETNGTSGYNAVKAINDWRAATWPNQYIDVRAWLVKRAIYEAGITPTTADTTAMDGDTVPPSVAPDGTHFTAAVSTLLGAWLALELRKRGL